MPTVDGPIMSALGLPRNFLRGHRRAMAQHFSSDESGRFSEIFGVAAAAELLAHRVLRPPFIRVVKDRSPIDFTEFSRKGRHGSGVEIVDPYRLMDQFARGSSIILQGLDEIWLPVEALCRALENELKLAVHANAYITPPRAQAMPIHTDDHDVIALQVHGSKTWRTYPPGRSSSSPDASASNVTLGMGDVLYVPKGAPHVAASRSESSIHIALAILPSSTPLSGGAAGASDHLDLTDADELVRRALLAEDPPAEVERATE